MEKSRTSPRCAAIPACSNPSFSAPRPHPIREELARRFLFLTMTLSRQLEAGGADEQQNPDNFASRFEVRAVIDRYELGTSIRE